MTARRFRPTLTGSPGHRITRVVALLLACCVSASCRDPVIPEQAFPPSARPMDPVPDIYPEWWAEVEECSGIKGNYRAATFYEVPSASGWMTSSGFIEGAWLKQGNRITVGEYRKLRSRLLRHEMLHAILRTGDHPNQYFVAKCGALVDATHNSGGSPGQ